MVKHNKLLIVRKIKNKFFFCINKKMKAYQVKGSAAAKAHMAKLRAMRKRK